MIFLQCSWVINIIVILHFLFKLYIKCHEAYDWATSGIWYIIICTFMINGIVQSYYWCKLSYYIYSRSNYCNLMYIKYCWEQERIQANLLFYHKTHYKLKLHSNSCETIPEKDIWREVAKDNRINKWLTLPMYCCFFKLY